jgi:chromate reductase
MTINIAAFCGSIRKESFTAKVLHAFENLAPGNVKFTLIDISELPFINEDLETQLPRSVINLYDHIENADAIVLASPEYNRSYSPILKNALDWGARPEGKNKWAKKPTAILGCSPYSLGAFGAVNHLRQVAMYLDMYVLQQPEFYLSKAAERFNQDGQLIDEDTRQIITNFWTAFVAWIEMVSKKNTRDGF